MFQHQNCFNSTLNPIKTTQNANRTLLKKKHKKLRKYGEQNQRYKITVLLSRDKNI